MRVINGTGGWSDDDLFYRDETDTNNPGSIIWTGKGNAPTNQSSNSMVGDVSCFSEAAEVQVLLPMVIEGGGMDNNTVTGSTATAITTIKAMKDLVIGDRVLTATSNNNFQFEPIYAFGHRNEKKKIEFLAIYMADSSVPLEVSDQHMIFLDDTVSDIGHPVEAGSIRVGDVLRGDSMARKVTKILKVQKEGIYAPLTRSGTLVVNGVVASSYAVFRQETSSAPLDILRDMAVTPFLSQHDYCHMGLAPFRLYCALSRNFCTQYDEDGKPYYVAFSIWLTNLVHALPGIFQLLYICMFLLVTGVCCLLEKVISTPTLVVAAVTVCCITARSNHQTKQNLDKNKNRIKSI